jgi:hypothetical protein
VPRLGQKRDFTSAKAQAMLGWRPRALEETVLDCARSQIAITSLRCQFLDADRHAGLPKA